MRADVLLVVATEVELDAVVECARAITGTSAPALVHADQRTYHDLGVIGGARVLVVQSEMGAATVGGSLSTVTAALHEVDPATILMVGIAFGFDHERDPVGQILVATQVQHYESARVGTSAADGEERVQPRGNKVPASPRVISRLRAARSSEHPVRFGLILSGEKLVDNHAFRDRLRQLEPEAVGGEMEAAGVLAAALERRVDWGVVKAVCDYADGHKDENKRARQQLAARNAARFVLAAVAMGGFRRQEDSRDTRDVVTPPAERPRWMALAEELKEASQRSWWTRLQRLIDALEDDAGVRVHLPSASTQPGDPEFLWAYKNAPRDVQEHGRRAYVTLKFFSRDDLPRKIGDFHIDSHALARSRQAEVADGEWPDQRRSLYECYVEPMVAWLGPQSARSKAADPASSGSRVAPAPTRQPDEGMGEEDARGARLELRADVTVAPSTLPPSYSPEALRLALSGTFEVTNAGLDWAYDIKVAVVMQTTEPAGEPIPTSLRAHVDVRDAGGAEPRLVWLAFGDTPVLAPFQTLRSGRPDPQLCLLTQQHHVMWGAAVLVVCRGRPPAWYQLAVYWWRSTLARSWILPLRDQRAVIAVHEADGLPGSAWRPRADWFRLTDHNERIEFTLPAPDRG